MARRAAPAPRARRAPLVRMASRVLTARRVRLAPRGHRAVQVKLVPRVRRVRRATRAPQARWVIRGLSGPRGALGHRARRGRLASRVLLDPPGLPGRPDSVQLRVPPVMHLTASPSACASP